MDRCPACHVDVDQPHKAACDVARCGVCEQQRLRCGCSNRFSVPSIWMGMWPGEAEAAARGWYARLVDGQGWVPCASDEDGAQPDLNRLKIFQLTGRDPYASPESFER